MTQVVALGHCLPPTRQPTGRKCRFCPYAAIAETSAAALEAIADHLLAVHPEQLEDLAIIVALLAEARADDGVPS